MAPVLGLTPLAPPSKSDQFSPIESTFNNNDGNNNNNDDDNVSQMSQNDDDSWEVRAFEEDTTGNLLGCTWPPRSYTCTFCRREFRSAQALGGHMNVHRGDRARLHEAPPPPLHPSPPTILIQTGQEFSANGLCLVYPFLPNPSSIIFPNPKHFITNKPAETAPNSVVSSTNTEPSASNSNDDNNNSNRGFHESAKDEEELDLELRLGRRPPPP